MGAKAAALALTKSIAVFFGISTNAAAAMLGSMLPNSVSYIVSVIADPGGYVAKSLDKNGNGWIGLYQRTDYTTGNNQWKTE